MTEMTDTEAMVVSRAMRGPYRPKHEWGAHLFFLGLTIGLWIGSMAAYFILGWRV